jgi:FlaG/FlaF family flagellin (archaellin)
MLAMTPLMIFFTALLAAVVVVLAGVISMLKGGAFNRKYGNIAHALL